MIKWLDSLVAKPDHPFADLQEVDKVLSELEVDDPVKSLDELSFWLDSVSRIDEFSTDRRYAIIDLLDQAGKSHQRKIGKDYLCARRLQKYQEHRLWTGNYQFLKHVGNAYLHCFDQNQSARKESGVLKQIFPYVVSRALRNIANQLKWKLLRYGPAESEIWKDLARLYQNAEKRGSVDTPVTIYPGVSGESTLKQEFLRTVMLGVSSADSLIPARLEIAEHIIWHLSGLFTLDKQRTAACTHCFNLDGSKPPSRIAKTHGTIDTMRFFGAGEAMNELKKLIGRIEAIGVPREIDLGGVYNPKFVLAVLEHLKVYWSDKPPARRHERRHLVARLSVVHGFDAVSAAIAGEIGGPFDDDDIESWIAENVSDGGYGAIVPRVKADWIRIGGMVALKSESESIWRVGIVRRISCDEKKQKHVGIQCLSKAAFITTLCPISTPVPLALATGEPRENLQCILLTPVREGAGELSLLLSAGKFSSTDSYQMMINNREYRLVPAKLVEGGEDFDLAKFAMLERAAAA